MNKFLSFILGICSGVVSLLLVIFLIGELRAEKIRN